MLISFSGMLILLSPHFSHAIQTPPMFWWGIAAMLLNTLFWALGSIYVRKRKPPTSSLAMGVGLQNLTAGLALIAPCLLTLPPVQTIHPSPLSLGALLYLIVFGTMVAAPCYIYMLRRLPVSISSTFAYVTPVITVIFGYLALGESLGNRTILGMSIILAGVILVQCLSQKQIAVVATENEAAVAAVDGAEQAIDLSAAVIAEEEKTYTATGSISIASRR
jgi:drug/metabolite transporter (DMT)-like permease